MNNSIFINRLNKIRKLNGKDSGFVNKNLYQLLCKEEALVAGYELIKSNKGATTVGSGNSSLDGFSLRRIQRLQKKLRNESWSPSPARRIYIPKPGRAEKRPLGIQGPEEKVVQSVLNRILEAIYEPIFSPFSYGFRPSIGVHEALKRIDNNYDGLCFAIEGDIKGMYDNVNHHQLILLLKRKIEDDRLIRLIWKLLRAGYMEKGKEVNSVLGTPQGSIVSPCLANIYLHELDLFMHQECKQVTERSGNIRTPAFKIIEKRRRQLSKLLDNESLPSENREQYILEIKKLKKRSLKTRMYCDPSNRIIYTRYADDFLVGIAGSKMVAEEIKEKIRICLEDLKLTLSAEKTKITNIREEPAYFLGHQVGINTSVKIKRIHVKGLTPYTRRVTGKLVAITAPIEDIVARLHLKGFCDRKGYPKHKLSWITQEDNQIITLFNYTSRGLFQFYSGVKKKRSLSRIKYILKFSCAMTLAAKHNSSLAKIYRKHGGNLRVCYGDKGEKEVSLSDASLKNQDKRWVTGRKLSDPYKHIATRISKTKIYDKCCICGGPSAEMHHVRHLRDANIKDSGKGFTRRIMGFINRKQIPVCLQCHNAIHAGRYDGINLRDFVYPEIARK